MASVAVRNAFHFGTAGRYARLMAEQDCVGFVMSNTRPLMPATGGAEAITGNNPIAIALPSAGDFPVEVDMALSATAMGKIRLAAAAGQSIPADWAMAADGKPTTDPNEAIKGMLAPAAGPKGFGLAFVIDLLCGGLSGGGLLPGRPGAGEARRDGGLRRRPLRGARDVRRLQPPHDRALLRAPVGDRQGEPALVLRRGIEDDRVRDRRAARLGRA